MRYAKYITFASLAFMFLTVTALMGQSMEKDNEALVKRLYSEVINQQNLDVMDDLVADDFVEHETTPGDAQGKQGVKEYFAMMFKAFPDLQFKVNDMVSDGDKVWAYITITGTQKGPFMDMQATGKTFQTDAFDIIRIKNGKIAEHWGVTDSGKMMQQLGMMAQK